MNHLRGGGILMKQKILILGATEQSDSIWSHVWLKPAF